jgi:hypothetical protein
MILCDTHVHIHEDYSVNRFLSSAYNNFCDISDLHGLSVDKTQFVLALTESAGSDKFSELKAYRNPRTPSEWSMKSGNEACLLTAESGHRQIILIAGRQVVCKENIEMLALGTREQIPDGTLLKKAIQQALAKEALPVLPWGFGKWIGRRGQIIHHLIQQQDGFVEFLLGDICGRPNCLGKPEMFRKATAKGIRILAGSDPLPLPNGHVKVGRYVTAIDLPIEKNLTPKRLFAILRNPESNVSIAGKRLALVSFMMEQLLLRLYGINRRRIGMIT